MGTQYPSPGFSDAGSYVCSGVPWITGSTAEAGAVTHFSFPGVTKFIVVRNTGAGTLAVGFSSNGVTMTQNHHRFTLTGGQESPVLELRVADIYLSASAGLPTYEIIAGLTPIPYSNAPIMSGSMTGSIYSGIG